MLGFVEKPQKAEQLVPLKTPTEWIESRGIPCNERHYLASMGIYLFNRKVLCNLLNSGSPATDFGKEIFPRSISSLHVQTYLFDGYWEDVGTIKSYHEANLALCGDKPPFLFNHPDGVIYTRARYLPASLINDAKLDHALVSDGCLIQKGTVINRCVIGLRTQIGRNVTLSNTVVLGADHFDSPSALAENARRGVPNTGIGNGTVIDNAIIDKDCCIGANCRIVNVNKVKNGEGKNYVIRDGIVVIPKGAVVEDGTEI